MVDRILAANRADAAADVTAWEREIDERVYRLYGLRAAEIKMVEGEASDEERTTQWRDGFHAIPGPGSNPALQPV